MARRVHLSPLFQFFVSVICVAIALPVSLFIENLFERANEVEGARESWLSFGGKWKLLLGAHAHRDWHWTDRGRKPASELVRWLAQSDGADARPFAERTCR